MFLSREERAAIAIEKRKQEIAAQRRAANAVEPTKASPAENNYRIDYDGDGPMDNRRKRSASPPPPRRQRSSSPPAPRQREQGEAKNAQEIEILRNKQKYLVGGAHKKVNGVYIDPQEAELMQKRKQRKTAHTVSAAKRFMFDWDAEEDTTAYDVNPLYQKKQQAAFYGRGHLAGIDASAMPNTAYWDRVVKERSGEEGSIKSMLVEVISITNAKAALMTVIGATRHWVR